MRSCWAGWRKRICSRAGLEEPAKSAPIKKDVNFFKLYFLLAALRAIHRFARLVLDRGRQKVLGP